MKRDDEESAENRSDQRSKIDWREQTERRLIREKQFQVKVREKVEIICSWAEWEKNKRKQRNKRRKD